jgi:hypothetical protein
VWKPARLHDNARLTIELNQPIVDLRIIVLEEGDGLFIVLHKSHGDDYPLG